LDRRRESSPTPSQRRRGLPRREYAERPECSEDFWIDIAVRGEVIVSAVPDARPGIHHVDGDSPEEGLAAAMFGAGPSEREVTHDRAIRSWSLPANE
jgi:hypothetical protein